MVMANAELNARVRPSFAMANRLIALLLVCLFAVLAGMQQGFAGAVTESIDCAEVAVDYVARPELTAAERLAEMEQAFFESVNHFELCNLAVPASANGAAAGGMVSEDGTTVIESVASPSVTGTEAEPIPPPDAELEATTEVPEEATKATVAGSMKTNGAIPEDIPNVDNDDVIAEQIRLAATIETDPAKQARLWNEYRKYKGLPIKEAVVKENE